MCQPGIFLVSVIQKGCDLESFNRLNVNKYFYLLTKFHFKEAGCYSIIILSSHESIYSTLITACMLK